MSARATKEDLSDCLVGFIDLRTEITPFVHDDTKEEYEHLCKAAKNTIARATGKQNGKL